MDLEKDVTNGVSPLRYEHGTFPKLSQFLTKHNFNCSNALSV